MSDVRQEPPPKSELTLDKLWTLLKNLTLGEMIAVLGALGTAITLIYSFGVWSGGGFAKLSKAEAAPTQTSQQTYYGYYGDLGKEDQPVVRQETLRLREGARALEGTSTGVVSEGGHQIEKTWRFSGQRTGEALALTFTTLPDKNDAAPSGIGVYQLQRLGSYTFTGTAIFWDCESRSFLQCPYVLSPDNIDPATAKSRWPQVLGRKCERLDLTPDRGPTVVSRACVKLTMQ